MRSQAVLRFSVSALLTALVAAVGLAACTGSTTPPPPVTDQTPVSSETLVIAWSSTEYGNPYSVVEIPEGWRDLHFRVRCTGSGELTVFVTGRTKFWQNERAPCIAKWELSLGVFPPDNASDQDLGPYSVVIDSPDTIMSWDVEVYFMPVTRASPVSPSAHPSALTTRRSPATSASPSGPTFTPTR
ncbi:hypothetical protein [Dactylosporangium sp. CA-139066]|uniref:hypothetical protein n=1 Tax=Dactylosporangium sp. CA-139066 TaxID=3239930 RepID=UPI003D8B5360